MPEMPEVEVMTQNLQKFVGKTIKEITIDKNKRYLGPDQIVKTLGQKINGVFRRGKFMVFMLEHGAILAHNAMSGYWDTVDTPWTFDYVEGKRVSKDSDVRAMFLLEDGRVIRFHDARSEEHTSELQSH